MVLRMNDFGPRNLRIVTLDEEQRGFLHALAEAGFLEYRPHATRIADSQDVLMAAINRTVIGGDAGFRSSEDRANAWLTPQWLIEEVRVAFGGAIDLDPCSEPDNPTRAKRFWTSAHSALKRRWPAVRIYCNPPYSPLSPWVDKCVEAAEEGARVYVLLPVRTDAQYHQKLFRAATDVLFLRGRVKFERADGGEAKNPAFGSMVVGLNKSCKPLEHLGTLLTRLE